MSADNWKDFMNINYVYQNCFLKGHFQPPGVCAASLEGQATWPSKLAARVKEE